MQIFKDNISTNSKTKKKETAVDNKPVVDKIKEFLELQKIESEPGLKYNTANITKDCYNDKERIQVIDNICRRHME